MISVDLRCSDAPHKQEAIGDGWGPLVLSGFCLPDLVLAASAWLRCEQGSPSELGSLCPCQVLLSLIIILEECSPCSTRPWPGPGAASAPVLKPEIRPIRVGLEAARSRRLTVSDWEEGTGELEP